jgi:hypothetical protein
MRARSVASRAAISGLHERLLLGDLAGLRFALVLDPGLPHVALLQAALLLHLLARGDLLGIDGPLARDLAATHLALGGDARLGDDTLVDDACLLDGFAGRDHRLLGLGVAGGAFAGELRALLGAAELDVPLLVEPRFLASRARCRAPASPFRGCAP